MSSDQDVMGFTTETWTSWRGYPSTWLLCVSQAPTDCYRVYGMAAKQAFPTMGECGRQARLLSIFYLFDLYNRVFCSWVC